MLENKYKRIIILGSTGSGKTHLAKMISKTKKIPIYYLDKEYWLPNWRRPSEQEWKKKLMEITNNESWVMDGNYIETLDIRLSRAELVIMLDINQKKCLRGVFFRTLKGLFFKRKDLGYGCKDSFNHEYMELIKWAKQFKKIYYPQLIEICKKYPNIEIKEFKSRKEAKKYVKKELNNE